MAFRDFINFLRGANSEGLYRQGNAYFKEDPYAIGGGGGVWYDTDTYHASQDPNPPITRLNNREKAISEFYDNLNESIGDKVDGYASMQKDFDVVDNNGTHKKYTVTYGYLPDNGWTIVGVGDNDTGKYYSGKNDLTSFFRNNFSMDDGYYDVKSSGVKNLTGGRMNGGLDADYYNTEPSQYRYEIDSMPETRQFSAGALFSVNPSSVSGYKRYGGQ